MGANIIFKTIMLYRNGKARTQKCANAQSVLYFVYKRRPRGVTLVDIVKAAREEGVVRGDSIKNVSVTRSDAVRFARRFGVKI